MEYGLTDKKLFDALSKLSDELQSQNIEGELCICGGAAMVLAFKARTSTQDVDSIFAPSQEIREAAAKVAKLCNLPQDWINDGVKGYIDSDAPRTTDGLPQFSNLRIERVSTEYLFYMKCRACRLSDGSSDLNDISYLAKVLQLSSYEDALKILEKFNLRRLEQKLQYVLEELFDSADNKA